MGRTSLLREIWGSEGSRCHDCGRPTVLVTLIGWDEARGRFIEVHGPEFPRDMATGQGVPPPPGSPPGTKGRVVVVCRRCKGLRRRAHEARTSHELEDYEALLAAPVHSLNRTQRKRRARLRLWMEDQRCRECGQLTVLITPIKFAPNLGLFVRTHDYPENAATLEHVFSRLNPRRGTEPGVLSLSCRRCNSEENNLRDMALYSSLEDQHRRSGHLGAAS